MLSASLNITFPSFLPIGSLKPHLGWSRYRDANPVPTSPLVDDMANALSGLVYHTVHWILCQDANSHGGQFSLRGWFEFKILLNNEQKKHISSAFFKYDLCLGVLWTFSLLFAMVFI